MPLKIYVWSPGDAGFMKFHHICGVCMCVWCFHIIYVCVCAFVFVYFFKDLDQPHTTNLGSVFL